MRVFVTGASGAIGAWLVPQLVERGHEVIGTSRSPEKAAGLRALGADGIALDVLDRGAVREAVLAAPTRSSTRRPRSPAASTSRTSTGASPRRTGSAPREPTPCSPPPARPA